MLLDYTATMERHRDVNAILGRTPPRYFYHGTSEVLWQRIQQEGVLFGKNDAGYRYTYLTEDVEVARAYAKPVLLQVEYIPVAILDVDNYGFNPPEGQTCWQFSVFIPIPTSHIVRIDRPRSFSG